MTLSKIVITLDENLLREVDSWVEQKLYSNRSQAVQSALFNRVIQLNQQRLEAECAKLNPQEERDFAELDIDKILGGWGQY
jgi:metal-responsive CopG/Arc/MetJ family transcriptional regulator